MSIQKVHVKKFLALDNFEAELKGRNILLLGENGVGKSSFLRFIKIATGDTSLIPQGAPAEGTVVLDKNGKEYTFKVEISKNGKVKVSVESDGLTDERKGSIANIVGATKFNIDEFVKLSESKAGQKEQVKIFKSFLQKEIQDDLTKFEAHIESLYNERTVVNKEKAELEKLINNHALRNVSDLSIYKEVSISELTKKKEEIRLKLNNEYKNAKDVNEQLRKGHQVKCDKLREEVRIYNEEIETNTAIHKEAELCHTKLKAYGYKGGDLFAFIGELKSKIKDKKEYVAPAEPDYVTEMPDDSPIKKIDDEILNATQSNSNYISAQQLIKWKGQLVECENISDDLTVKIESERQAISDTIKQMDSPVEGLQYNGDSLYYNGVEVSINAMSTSEIIELGVKLKMAENKDLGILLIEHGESIGKERLQYILDIAKNNGFQVIMEQVQRGQDKLTIEIIGE